MGRRVDEDVPRGSAAREWSAAAVEGGRLDDEFRVEPIRGLELLDAEPESSFDHVTRQAVRLRDGSGSRFDSRVVKAFLDLREEGYGSWRRVRRRWTARAKGRGIRR